MPLVSEGWESPLFHHPGGEQRPGAVTQLAQGPGDVVGDRVLGALHLRGDLAVGESSREQARHFLLAAGESRRVLLWHSLYMRCPWERESSLKGVRPS